MVQYKCPRCGYTTKIKNDYRKHINRKTECIDLLESNIPFTQLRSLFEPKTESSYKYTCDACGKEFKSAKSRWTHKYRYHSSLDKDNNSVDTKLVNAIIQQMSEKGITTSNIIINNNSNNVNQNNIQNNQVNAYGTENFDHLLQKVDFMTNCFLHKAHGLAKLIEKMHCDSEHPENMNIRITNKKLPYIDRFDGESWVKEDKNGTLDDIINSGKNLMDEHVYENQDAIKRRAPGDLYSRALHWFDGLKYVLSEEDPKYMKILKDLRSRINIVIMKHSNKMRERNSTTSIS